MSRPLRPRGRPRSDDGVVKTACTVFWTSGRTGSPGSPPTGPGEEPEQDELDELRVGKARLVVLLELADLSRFGFGLGVVE